MASLDPSPHESLGRAGNGGSHFTVGQAGKGGNEQPAAPTYGDPDLITVKAGAVVSDVPTVETVGAGFLDRLDDAYSIEGREMGWTATALMAKPLALHTPAGDRQDRMAFWGTVSPVLFHRDPFKACSE